MSAVARSCCSSLPTTVITRSATPGNCWSWWLSVMPAPLSSMKWRTLAPPLPMMPPHAPDGTTIRSGTVSSAPGGPPAATRCAAVSALSLVNMRCSAVRTSLMPPVVSSMRSLVPGKCSVAWLSWMRVLLLCCSSAIVAPPLPMMEPAAALLMRHFTETRAALAFASLPACAAPSSAASMPISIMPARGAPPPVCASVRRRSPSDVLSTLRAAQERDSRSAAAGACRAVGWWLVGVPR
mmetsp:Transcript_17531/g.44860  ORF Transcript_17531/g.44860 Transcript_17531/m.44860 type:complete len:238 (+) Transcript_17531:172-885(+)